MKLGNLARWCIAGFGLLVISGCATVKPWEKGNFTKEHMAFDPDPLESRFYRHVYESREASSGGYGVSVVGCGCN